MSTAVCTLFEGDYHHGVAALANSLLMNGFQGTLWAGYRGPLPDWCKHLENVDLPVAGEAVHGGMRIAFVPVQSERHLTNEKARFMLRVLEDLDAAAGGLYYFDPDLVLDAPWRLIEDWAKDGIAVSEDINSPMGYGHPWINEWVRLATHMGYTMRLDIDKYANGGFVGLKRENLHFLREWETCISMVGEQLGDLHSIKAKDRYNAFATPDQDALNIALRCTNVPMKMAGKGAMGFGAGLALIPHMAGMRKPWKGGMLVDALREYPPAYAQKAFLSNAGKPFNTLSERRKAMLSFSIRAAALIGRFYRRSQDG